MSCLATHRYAKAPMLTSSSSALMMVAGRIGVQMTARVSVTAGGMTEK